MPRLSKAHLEKILTENLNLAQPCFRLEKSGARFNGSIISDTFQGKGSLERQEMIWDALDRVLGAESTHSVGMLLAYTPEEWDMDLEGRPSSKHGLSR